MLQKTRKFLTAVRKDYGLYLLFLVPLIWYLVFMYYPMYGLQIAFRRYNAKLGITGSPWVGLANYRRLFGSYDFKNVFANTLIIAGLNFVFGFPAPVLLALMPS